MRITLSAQEPILNKENLVRIKQAILEGGDRCLWSNRYSATPCLRLGRFTAYLLPDPGPNGEIINPGCDTTKGGFNTLLFHGSDFEVQYQDVNFLDPEKITLGTDRPEKARPLKQLRVLPEQAVMQALQTIDAAPRPKQ